VEELQDEDRLEKLRTAVVVKTYSKLMEHYRSASAETAAAMMRNVKAFSAALFKNLSGSSSRCADLHSLATLHSIVRALLPTIHLSTAVSCTRGGGRCI
jgi:hypothetical protein